MGGCSARGDAEAQRGTIARIVASEKCILARRVEELVTVELLVCIEEEPSLLLKDGTSVSILYEGRGDLIRTEFMRYGCASECCRSFGAIWNC